MFKTVAQRVFPGRISSTDRLDEYVLEWEGQGLAQELAASGLKDLIACAKRLHSRDNCEIQVVLDGGSVSVDPASPDAESAIDGHLRYYDSTNNLGFKLVVWKAAVSGRLSVFDLNALGKCLNEATLADSLKALSGVASGGMLFECYEDGVVPFGSPAMKFAPAGGESVAVVGGEGRAEIFSVFSENCSLVGVLPVFLPSDFDLVEGSSYPEVQSFFRKVMAALSIIFIVNSSVLKGDALSYKLIGYKSVSGEISSANLHKSLPLVYRVFGWAYANGGSSDRIGLARNVISLHSGNFSEFDDGGALWNAIQSNYQIYLKGNISAYLEVKSKVAELLVDASGKAHAVAQGLTSSLKSCVGLLVSFVLGVVIINGIKDSNSQAFYSASYFAVAVVVLIICTAWLGYEISSARRSLRDASDATRQVLMDGYSKVLDRAEIDQSLAPVISRNEDFLKDEVGKIWRFWGLVCLGVAILFFAGSQIPKAAESQKPGAAAVSAPAVAVCESQAESGESDLDGCYWPNIAKGYRTEIK